MEHFIKKGVGLVAVSTMAATALALVPQTGTAATSLQASAASAAGGRVVTDFGFSHTAYGSKTTGNPSARSDATALSHLGCTRVVPMSNQNHVSTAGDGDQTELRNVRSRGVTRRSGGAVYVESRNTIESGTLASGQVTFSNLRAVAKTSHRAAGFSTKTVSTLGSLSIAGLSVPVPTTAEQEVPVPGQGTLIFNTVRTREGARAADASVNVMRFEGDDGSVTRVGKAFSHMDSGISGGVFHGAAWGSESRTGKSLEGGRGALKPIGCMGTNGKVLRNATGEGSSDFGFVGARRSYVYGKQGARTATGYTRSNIDSARFGGGALVFRNINSKANVTRQADGDVIRNAKGTGVGKILVNGQEIEQPPAGEPRRVAGVGTFTIRTVKKNPIGIDVTAVIVRLFNGAQADTVVELGRAKLKISKS